MPTARIITAPPVVAVLADMHLDWAGVDAMLEWVRDRRPACVPEEWIEAKHHLDLGPKGRGATLFPHDLHNGTSCETSWVWTTNPIALAKLVQERAGEAADLEFQRLARRIAAIACDRWPNLFPQPWMEAAELADMEAVPCPTP